MAKAKAKSPVEQLREMQCKCQELEKQAKKDVAPYVKDALFALSCFGPIFIREFNAGQETHTLGLRKGRPRLCPHQ